MDRKITAVVVIGVGLVAVAGVLESTGHLSGKHVAGLATGASADSGGCAGSVTELPAASPADIKLGEIIDDVQPVRRPGPEDPWQDAIEGQYVIALAPGAWERASLDGGRLSTHIPELDAHLEALAFSGVGPVFQEMGLGDFPTEHLGLERMLRVSSPEDLDTIQQRLAGRDDVEWVEPVVRVRPLGQPNDPYFAYQWHLSTLNITQAWDISDGSGAVVAVVDTGVSGNGSDGFDHLLSGWDFLDDDADPSDTYGHGTHVAGTIAQATDNGRGVAGMAPGASILPVRVMDENGGTSTDVAQGIIWAVDNGADIINLSLGSSSASTTIESACAYAQEAGVLVVAAAGNDGYRNFVSYPAAYASTLAVGALDLNSDLSYYSNQGPELDIAAPGGDLTHDRDGDGMADGVLQETRYEGAWGYYFFQGTSMASPHVAGAAALLYAHGITDGADMRQALLDTAQDLGEAGWDKSYGHGIISPVDALAWTDSGVEPEELELLSLSYRSLSHSKVLITWLTQQKADSAIEGDNGYTRDMQVYSNSHFMLGRGATGSTVVFTVTSTTEDGQTGSATIQVEIP